MRARAAARSGSERPGKGVHTSPTRRAEPGDSPCAGGVHTSPTRRAEPGDSPCAGGVHTSPTRRAEPGDSPCAGAGDSPSRAAASAVPCAAREVPPSTAHVAAAVTQVCTTGSRRPTRSAAMPSPTAAPTRTAVCATPAPRRSAYHRRSKAAASDPNPATGCHRAGSANTASASAPTNNPTARERARDRTAKTLRRRTAARRAGSAHARRSRSRRAGQPPVLQDPHVGGGAAPDRLGVHPLGRGRGQPRPALLLHRLLCGPADGAVHERRGEGLAAQRARDRRVRRVYGERADVRAGQRDRNRLPGRGERARHRRADGRAEPARQTPASRGVTIGEVRTIARIPHGEWPGTTPRRPPDRAAARSAAGPRSRCGAASMAIAPPSPTTCGTPSSDPICRPDAPPAADATPRAFRPSSRLSAALPVPEIRPRERPPIHAVEPVIRVPSPRGKPVNRGDRCRRPTPMVPDRSPYVQHDSSHYRVNSPDGSVEALVCSSASRPRSSTLRIFPEIVFGSGANSRRRIRL